MKVIPGSLSQKLFSKKWGRQNNTNLVFFLFGVLSAIQVSCRSNMQGSVRSMRDAQMQRRHRRQQTNMY